MLIVLFLAGPSVAGAAPPAKVASRAPVAFTWDAAMAQIRAVLTRFLPSPTRPPVTPNPGADPCPSCT